MKNPKLLIVDDDDEIRSQLKWALNKDYEILMAEDRPGALMAYKQHQPLVTLLDLGLPPNPGDPVEGQAALAEILTVNPRAKVIIASGQGEKANMLKAVGHGAYDFLCKPVNLDELKIILFRAFHVAQLEREFQDLQRQQGADTFQGMLGTSPLMQEAFSTIRKVATTDVPVLVLGDSGTGKEMTARAIHNCSLRKNGPFVAINCGAIPENLLESELFGHEKGSFTGAHAQRQGRIELADKGTLFLDEVGELPTPLQVKLLRFLQEHTIERVGGRATLDIDTRVVAATNADLKQLMSAGTFREDLFYRLAVLVIKVPALRERRGDILLLAHAFLNRFGAENNRKNLKYSPESIEALQQHPWPGNVRELENRVRRAVIMADGALVQPPDLELGVVPAGAMSRHPATLKEAREMVELEMIQIALHKHQGKISRAALELGVSRPTLYELMEKLGIKREVTE